MRRRAHGRPKVTTAARTIRGLLLLLLREARVTNGRGWKLLLTATRVRALSITDTGVSVKFRSVPLQSKPTPTYTPGCSVTRLAVLTRKTFGTWIISYYATVLLFSDEEAKLWNTAKANSRLKNKSNDIIGIACAGMTTNISQAPPSSLVNI